MVNDLFVLKKIKEGDIRSFEAVFRLYYSPLCLYAATITGRMDVSEEIVQELFYVFWKEKDKLQLHHSIRSYLYGSVRNRSLHYCAHREVAERHRREVASEAGGSAGAADPQLLLEYKELEDLVARTLSKLSGRCLRIFQMHRLEGKKYAEIASALSLSVKTVEAEMTRALRSLRKEIERYTS